MELLQLQYFQIVAREQNISRAAEKLHVSQPSLSQSIKRLELELGAELFTRNGRSIVLNENGKHYLKYVNSALAALNSGKKEIEAISKGALPGIVINAQLGTDTLLPLLTSFIKEYPGIELFVRKEGVWISTPANYDLELKTYPADLALPEPSITLFEEELMVAVPNGHHLANKLYVNLEDLKDEHFIMFESVSVYRQSIERYCQQAGFLPHVTCEGHDRRLICDFIRAGMGISIVPKHSWKSLLSGISLIPIQNQRCSRKIIIAWLSDERLTVSSELFIKHAVQYYQNRIDAP